MAKVTLSVPDDLYAKIEELKDRLNLSDIFRVAVSGEIEKFHGLGEIIVKLHEYLMAKLPSPDIEVARKEERDRFTRKWGEPKTAENLPRPPYVAFKKTQPVTVGNTTLVTLKIFNDFLWKASITDPHGLLEFDAEKWKSIGHGKLNYIVDYFKSKGFTVGEYQKLTPHMLADLVTDGDIRAAETISGGEFVPGLFAIDKEDIVFIAYRKAKFSKVIKEGRLQEIE